MENGPTFPSLAFGKGLPGEGCVSQLADNVFENPGARADFRGSDSFRRDILQHAWGTTDMRRIRLGEKEGGQVVEALGVEEWDNQSFSRIAVPRVDEMGFTVVTCLNQCGSSHPRQNN